MLLGQYEARLGEKHQVSFPGAFRKILGEKLVITKGLDKCLLVVAEKDWKALLAGTKNRTFTDKNTREVNRFLLGNASIVETDRKGRILIAQYLRKYCGIDKEVVFVGVERYVEIWGKEVWSEHQAFLELTVSSVAERLGERGE